MYGLLKVMQTNLKNTDRVLCNGSTWREITVLRVRVKARGFNEWQKSGEISQRRAGIGSTGWDGGQRRDHQGDSKITGCVGGII